MEFTKNPGLFFHQFQVGIPPGIGWVCFYQRKGVVEDLPSVVQSLKGVISCRKSGGYGSGTGIGRPGACDDGAPVFCINLTVFIELEQIGNEFRTDIQSTLPELLNLPLSVGHGLDDQVFLYFILGAMGSRNGNDHQYAYETG